MKHISPTFYVPVYHTNVFEADNIYKNPHSNVIHLDFCALLLFRSGAPLMTLLTDGVLTDPQLPVAASNMCTTDAMMGGIGLVLPPRQTGDQCKRLHLVAGVEPTCSHFYEPPVPS